MKAKEINKLADELTRELFANGAGEKAHRLKLMTKHGRDLGGWCFDSVLERITKALYKASSDKPADPR
jgi:hypothetical protein